MNLIKPLLWIGKRSESIDLTQPDDTVNEHL